jgi:hypothetical protein
MQKRELINQLKHIHLNFEFGLACISLINDPIAIKALPSLYVNFGSEKHTHDRVISILNSTNKSDVINSFFKMVLMCSTLKDSYNAVHYYCNLEPRKQYSKLSRQPYFQYVRMIRNAMSHGYKFNFKRITPERKSTLFPIEWNGKTILESDEGKKITQNKLTTDEIFKLLHELNQFVKNRLN